MEEEEFSNSIKGINDKDYLNLIDKTLEKMLSNKNKEIELQTFEADIGPLGSFKLEFAKEAIAIPEEMREDFVASAMGALMQSLTHPQLAASYVYMLIQLDYLTTLLTNQECKDN